MNYRLQDIQPTAIELWEQIKPHCLPGKCKIAGSIRRQCSTVKDIEVVCCPDGSSARNKIGMYLLDNAHIVKGKFTGRYVQLSYKGYPVDLFMPQSFDFYRILAIRTGSADFAKRIAWAWHEKGYIGTSDGLQEVSSRGHMLNPPSWDSEEQFFEWLGMEWVEPKNRF